MFLANTSLSSMPERHNRVWMAKEIGFPGAHGGKSAEAPGSTPAQYHSSHIQPVSKPILERFDFVKLGRFSLVLTAAMIQPYNRLWTAATGKLCRQTCGKLKKGLNVALNFC